jgi:hypothetical protein
VAWMFEDIIAKNQSKDIDLLIAVPNRNSFSNRCVGGLLTLRQPLQKYLFNLEVGQPIDLSRNIACAKALQLGAKYLLFIDSDMVPPPDGLEILLSDRRPIVSGVYRGRGEPYHIVANAGKNVVPDSILDAPQIVKVDEVGMGFCLIDTRVLKAMASQVLKEWRCFQNHEKEGTEVAIFSDKDAIKNNYKCTYCGQLIVARFFWSRLGMQNINAMSEDYFFCLNVRKLGYPIVLDTRVFVNHDAMFVESGRNGLENTLKSAGNVH